MYVHYFTCGLLTQLWNLKAIITQLYYNLLAIEL